MKILMCLLISSFLGGVSGGKVSFAADIISSASSSKMVHQPVTYEADNSFGEQEKAISVSHSGSKTAEEDIEFEGENNEVPTIADPLEPLNRIFFHVNDKLYFWVLKPAARGYSFILPEGVRIAVSNFFNNITTPVRFVNSILQFKFKKAGNELQRFIVNSTAGVLGLADPAKEQMGIKLEEEDFGQTLGSFGIGHGFYVHLPVLGPSSLRDTIGRLGDNFLEPVNYINPFLYDRLAIKSGDTINSVSLRIGEYEDLKKESFDPYIAVRDVYNQYRKKKVDE